MVGQGSGSEFMREGDGIGAGPIEHLGAATPDALLAEIRSDAAAEERSRQEWLTRQAIEEAGTAGVLLEFAERGAPIQVSVSGAGWLRGMVSAIGTNVVVLRPDRGGTAVVPVEAVVAIRPSPGSPAVWGDRSPQLASTVQEVLDRWLPDRPEVTVHAGDETFHGDLVGVGRDMITLEPDHDRRQRFHIALGHIALVHSLEHLTG